MRASWLTIAAGLLAGPASASTLAVELGGTAAQATDVSASAGTLLVRTTGDVDLAEEVTLHLDFAYTRALAQGPPAGLTVGSSGGNVFVLAAGVDLAVMDTALLSFELNLSPSSTVQQEVSASVGTLTFNPLVSSQSEAFGGTLAFGLSTGFERPVEASLEGALAVTRFDSDQQIVDRSGNPIPPGYCSGTRRPGLCALLVAEHGTGFTQSRVGGGATLTVLRDTDLGLSGAYYLYSDDPTQVGFFALATGGRLPASLGEPVPLAPVLWSIRPALTHRFGEAFRVGLYYEFSDCYAGEGVNNLLGIRASVRISREVRLVLRAEGQSFQDARGVNTLSASIVLATWLEL